MTVCQNKDLLSNIQSSYLWKTDEQQSNISIDIPTDDLNICNGLQKSVSSRFNTIMERSQLKSVKHLPTKESTATSLSEMHLTSSEETTSRKPWSPTNLLEESSQIPLIEEQKSSRFALLAKTGRPICRIRTSTIAFACLILTLCGLAIGIPMIFISRISNNPTTSTIVTTTSSTTTSSTSTVTTTTTTTTTSSTSTVTTTTTTTPPATEWIPGNYYTSCSITCINVSTVAPATLLASWTFEENTNDVSGNGNDGQITNGAAFTTGYIGQAIVLRNSSSQYVNVSYINLVNQSFTIEAWLYLYSSAPLGDHGILGECEIMITDHCLHCVVRQNRLYMGFFGDDLFGTTNLSVSVWYHIAFVYDYSLNMKSIYLNGLLDAVSAGSGLPGSLSAFLGGNGSVTIGGWGIPTSAYWDGLLDQVRITNRVKTPCEILNDASLIAYFPFDNNAVDIGPNSMTGTYNPQGNNGLSWVSGRVNQALNFNSSNSYFQSCGFYALGTDQSYSIAMWVNPSFQGGTLFHLSSAGTGSGAWCLPMIGFSSNGSIVVQTWRGNAVSIMGPVLPINTWTHIVQTYSSTNGLQLYINGGLYASATVNTFSSSTVTMCILLASSGLGTNCQTGSISMGRYSGAIDELYVYNRELTALEVCPLAHP